MKIKGLCESSDERDDQEAANFPFGDFPKIHRIDSPKHHIKSSENNRKHKYKKPERRRSIDKTENDEATDQPLSNTSDEENEMPVTFEGENAEHHATKKRRNSESEGKPLNMSNHGLLTEQVRIFYVIEYK